MARRSFFHIRPWLEKELVERGVVTPSLVLTSTGRALVLDNFDGFCTDQIARVVNTLHEAHRRIRLGPALHFAELQTGDATVTTRGICTPTMGPRRQEAD